MSRRAHSQREFSMTLAKPAACKLSNALKHLSLFQSGASLVLASGRFERHGCSPVQCICSSRCAGELLLKQSVPYPASRDFAAFPLPAFCFLSISLWVPSQVLDVSSKSLRTRLRILLSLRNQLRSQFASLVRFTMAIAGRLQTESPSPVSTRMSRSKTNRLSMI